MRATLAVTNVDDIEMTLTITMNAQRWKQLRRQLVDKYPSWDLSSKIRGLVDKADAHFTNDKEIE